MKGNQILEEIRQTREELAREMDHDLERLFAYVRGREREAAARGVKFVSFADAGAEELSSVREEPPQE